MHLKIKFRDYLISQLRNMRVLQSGKFAIEKETHPNPPCKGGNSGSAD